MFNNIFVYLNRFGQLPRSNQKAPPDIHCDGNLHWCADSEVTAPEKFLERVRSNPVSIENKKTYPPGWASESVVADPDFLKFDRNPEIPCDFRLQSGSPAIDGGVVLPTELEDPLRPTDNSRPDIGALPRNAAMFAAGRLQDTK